MHNNTNDQCKLCWNKALTFGVGSIQLSFRIYHCVHSIHANMFSIQMLLSNCAEGLHFNAFIVIVTILNIYGGAVDISFPFVHSSQLLVVPSNVAAAPLCSAMHPCLKWLYKTQASSMRSKHL